MILPAQVHLSYYWLGGEGKISLVLTEPYGWEPFNFIGIKHIVIPEPISAYGGNLFSTEVGLAINACSLLCVKKIHARYLDEVDERFTKTAGKLPHWNSVSGEERREARSRHLWGRK